MHAVQSYLIIASLSGFAAHSDIKDCLPDPISSESLTQRKRVWLRETAVELELPVELELAVESKCPRICYVNST